MISLALLNKGYIDQRGWLLVRISDWFAFLHSITTILTKIEFISIIICLKFSDSKYFTNEIGNFGWEDGLYLLGEEALTPFPQPKGDNLGAPWFLSKVDWDLW